jgi:hypothetical protein
MVQFYKIIKNTIAIITIIAMAATKPPMPTSATKGGRYKNKNAFTPNERPQLIQPLKLRRIQKETVGTHVIKQCIQQSTSFCLDLGCQHTRGKAYLSTGNLDAYVGEDRCETSCSIWTNKWHGQFLAVYSSGVVAFLEYLMQTWKLPKDFDYKSPISSLLAGNLFWKETVFEYINNTGR